MKRKFNYLFMGLLMASTITIISCDKEDEKLPPIDGYNSSDEIAASSLVAKWGLDGDAKESISGNVGVGSNVTYAAGKVGQAAVFNEGFIHNETIPNLHTKITGSFSISLWAQVRNNQTAATALAMLTGDVQTSPVSVTPGSILIETGHFAAVSDTFRVKSIVGVEKASGEFGLEDNVNWWGLDNINQPGQMVKIADGEWAHFVLVWNNTDKKIRLYVNKQLATNSEWETKTGANFKAQTSLGMIIGGFNSNAGLTNATEPWAKAMTGKVDQVRVYNNVLTEAEISALFNLEDAGR